MSSLMSILNNPESKEKITDLISGMGNISEKEPEPQAITPPPVPSALFNENDIFSRNGIEAMMKMKNIMERLNRKDDYRIGLLNSIKPFMKNGRERSIDTAIRFIQIINFASGR